MGYSIGHTVKLYAKRSEVAGDRLHVHAGGKQLGTLTDSAITFRDCLISQSSTKITSTDDYGTTGSTTTLQIAIHAGDADIPAYIGGRVELPDYKEATPVSYAFGDTTASYGRGYRITGVKHSASSPLYWDTILTCEAVRSV